MRRLNRGGLEAEGPPETPTAEEVRRRITSDQPSSNCIHLPPTFVDDDANAKKKQLRRRNISTRLFFQRNAPLVLSMVALICAGILVHLIFTQRKASSRRRRGSRLHDPRSTEKLEEPQDVATPRAAHFSVAFPQSSIKVKEPLSEPDPLSEELAIRMKVKNFGDLNIRFFKYDDDETPRRSIYQSERDEWTAEDLYYWDPVTEKHLEVLVGDENDYYYNFDDDVRRNPLIAYDDDTIQDEKLCRRTSWHRNVRINCNMLHEFDVQWRFLNGETSFLGNGAYREAYLSDLSEGETVIFKAYYWSANFEYFDFEYMRIDALVSEIFTSSPRIVDIYGYCGTGMINQAVMNGRMDRVAEPLGGEKNKRRSEIYRLPAEEGELEVLNDLTGTQKLEYALEMAEAITLLHSYPGGVIVHDDVTLEQFLLDDEGNVKLNDFNRAEFMLWNDEDQEYCRYKNNPGNGWWRAPEEYADKPLDEKIDIWSLGNNFYALLTGRSPFNRLKVDDGETAFIHPGFRDRSFGEQILAELIPRCWQFNPDDRIDIFELAERLRQAVAENRQHRSL